MGTAKTNSEDSGYSEIDKANAVNSGYGGDSDYSKDSGYSGTNSGDNVGVEKKTSDTEERGDKYAGLSYVELYNKLNPYEEQSDEDKKKERKKQRRERLFAAIGDGISALSNLFFTTKGAPSMVDGKTTMTGAVKARHEQLAKEREAKKTAYFNGYMKARQMDEQRADTERKWNRQQAIDEANARKAEEEKKRKDSIAEAQANKYEAQANKDVAQAAFWETKQKALEEGLPYDLALKKAQAAKERALKGKYDRTSGDKGSGKYMLVDPNGEVHYYPNKTMYEQGVAYYYPDENGDKTVRVTNRESGRKSTTTTTKAKTSAQKGAELQRKADEKAKQSAKSQFSIYD